MANGRSSALLHAVLAAALAGCAPPSAPPPDSSESHEAATPRATSLRDALSFHASFDTGSDADLARGDRALYTAPSYDELDEAEPGIGSPAVNLVEGVGCLGVFGDLHDWNPDEVQPDDFPAFGERLVVVDTPPFSRERWTHVVVSYSGLGSEAGGGATLFLDGTPVPETREGIDEAFTWDSPGSIRLGLSYVGLLDELALFDRALTAEEVAALHALAGGVADLHGEAR